MKKILLFARDPGGANTLIPLYGRLKDRYDTLVYGKDVAVEWFRKEGIPCKDIRQEWNQIDLHTMEDFLKNISPYFIVTGTSLDDDTERYLWKGAEKLGIKSFAIVDQWMNMGIRFSRYGYKECHLYEADHTHDYMPYRILVMDKMAKDALIKEGIQEGKIRITGQPHFEEILKKYKSGRMLLDDRKWNILFVSEPISQDYEDNSDTCEYWGYNEKRIFDALYEAVDIVAKNYGKKARLIVKPHPRENKDAWNEMIDKRKNGRIELLCSTKEDKYSLLKSVDMVCGMSSMMLLEAAICEKEIISIMIGLKRENPFVMDRLGICKSCLTKEELCRLLEQKLRFGKEKLNFEYIRDASEKVIGCIEEEM